MMALIFTGMTPLINESIDNFKLFLINHFSRLKRFIKLSKAFRLKRNFSIFRKALIKQIHE